MSRIILIKIVFVSCHDLTCLSKSIFIQFILEKHNLVVTDFYVYDT